MGPKMPTNTLENVSVAEPRVSFIIWNLRTSYLTHIKDGVGERLITLDPALVNDPAIRAAGYGSNVELYRTYSPPIPVATAVSEEYFNRPIKDAGPDNFGLEHPDNEDGDLKRSGSRHAIGLDRHARRHRRREYQKEDDSSDLSDESDEETETTHRATQQIKFAKLPVRTRAGSSPVRSLTERERPALPNKRRSAEERARRGSAGAVDIIRQRARRDTTTSSELSSENDGSQPASVEAERGDLPRPRRRSHSHEDSHTWSSPKGIFHASEPHRDDPHDPAKTNSSLSSDLVETADSVSLSATDADELGSSLLGNLGPPPSASENLEASPKKSRAPQPTIFQVLPPTRPISTIIPGSALGQAIQARKAKPKTPEELFARFSGKGALEPLNIRLFAPFSDTPSKAIDTPLQRNVQDAQTGAAVPVAVADVIGLGLWRYHEENLQPPIDRVKVDVNRWTLRIMDDGEVDFDFPALNRSGNIIDFTSNNNRQARGRSRGRLYDDFALVEATESQYAENKRTTPKYTKLFEDFNRDAKIEASQIIDQATDQVLEESLAGSTTIPRPFATASRKGSATLDRPTIPTVHSTPRIGPSKTLKVSFTNLEAQFNATVVEVTADTYIAEVLELVCKRWNLDKAHHFLRVTGTSIAAPSDRTVEVLGTYADLDLVRRRFAHAGTLGLASSPASSSPNAPLFLDSSGTPPSKRGRRPGPSALHPLASQQDAWGVNLAGDTGHKRYVVTRKQPMSFAPSHPRTLLVDREHLHILPGDMTGLGGGVTGDVRTALLETGSGVKTTSVPFSMIVGCKVSRRHPKSFRVVVFRERETKRYDFEAQTADEADEIVGAIGREMKPVRTDGL